MFFPQNRKNNSDFITFIVLFVRFNFEKKLPTHADLYTSLQEEKKNIPPTFSSHPHFVQAYTNKYKIASMVGHDDSQKPNKTIEPFIREINDNQIMGTRTDSMHASVRRSLTHQFEHKQTTRRHTTDENNRRMLQQRQRHR